MKDISIDTNKHQIRFSLKNAKQEELCSFDPNTGLFLFAHGKWISLENLQNIIEETDHFMLKSDLGFDLVEE